MKSVLAEQVIMNAWDQIKKELQSVLTEESYENWVSRTRFARLEGDLLIVSVPDEETKTWLQNEYSESVSGILRRLDLGIRSVAYSAHDSTRNHGPRFETAPADLDT